MNKLLMILGTSLREN